MLSPEKRLLKQTRCADIFVRSWTLRNLIRPAGRISVKVHNWSAMAWEEVTPSISRKIVTGVNEMIAHVRLEKGAVVPEHSHVSEQISYILEGCLKFWVGGEELILRAGDVTVIPPNAPHRVLALEDTLDVDIFSPIRQDWLDHTDSYFHRRDGE